MSGPFFNYFSFPFSSGAFFGSRGATSRREAHFGVDFRFYGRNVQERTLVSWEPGASLVSSAIHEALRWAAGHGKIKSVNFIHPPQDSTPLAKGPTEYLVQGTFDTQYLNRSKKTRETIRRSCRGITIRPVLRTLDDEEKVTTVFYQWLSWASTRHFMVFKGHYKEWLRRWFERPCPSPASFLFILEKDGTPLGIFGGEYYLGEAQITIAKHAPELSAKALWTLGLREVLGTYPLASWIHCGSTADTLKTSLGFQAFPSWVADVKTIRGELS